MTPGTAVTREDILRRNAEVVAAHMEREAGDLDAAMALYTDDVVWEVPSRGVVLRGTDRIKAHYRALFRSLTIHSAVRLRQVVTEEWVFDDQLLRVTLVDTRIPGLSFPTGTRLSVRKLAAFQLRDGLICREISHESWRPVGSPNDRDDIPD
ncbi:nuclear transport factor 2 family protein [Streptomyces sp. NPDC053048]|uniref:nuclear transport factor 2 family protein n=1 Tax=Streptomyces sp. NPDC053048 TaxID=3365694 RepID=UPI0037D4957F